MTVTESYSQAPAARAPLVRRMLTRPGDDPFELVGWCRRPVQITDSDGTVAFACEDVEAPISWSNLAVAIVARRYFASEPGLAPERSVSSLIERVVEVIAGWAQNAGHARRRCRPRSPSSTPTIPQLVAAVQPFLSGGVSRTVPVPADASVQAVEVIFLDAWRMGLTRTRPRCLTGFASARTEPSAASRAMARYSASWRVALAARCCRRSGTTSGRC
jgi:hypothetical protein